MPVQKPFRREHFERSADAKEIENHLLHGEVESFLSDEMDDLNKDVERSVSRNDHLGAFGEKRVDDGLKARLSGGVGFAFDTDHVDLEWGRWM